MERRQGAERGRSMETLTDYLALDGIGRGRDEDQLGLQMTWDLEGFLRVADRPRAHESASSSADAALERELCIGAPIDSTGKTSKAADLEEYDAEQMKRETEALKRMRYHYMGLLDE